MDADLQPIEELLRVAHEPRDLSLGLPEFINLYTRISNTNVPVRNFPVPVRTGLRNYVITRTDFR